MRTRSLSALPRVDRRDDLARADAALYAAKAQGRDVVYVDDREPELAFSG